MSVGVGLSVGPGGVFVVDAVVVYAAAQDADESVARGAHGLCGVGRRRRGVGRRRCGRRG